MEFRRTETFYCHHGVQGSDSGHMLEKINQLFSLPLKKTKVAYKEKRKFFSSNCC